MARRQIDSQIVISSQRQNKIYVAGIVFARYELPSTIRNVAHPA